jgi:hypothetical protein
VAAESRQRVRQASSESGLLADLSKSPERELQIGQEQWCFMGPMAGANPGLSSSSVMS